MDLDANFSFGVMDIEYGTGVRVDRLLELFSGEEPHYSNAGVSAACSRGLCAYFRVLKEVSFTKLNTASISMIPGRIQFEKKSYETLEDRYVVPDEDFEKTLHKVVRTGLDFDDLKLSIRESSTALECLLQLQCSGDATLTDETVVAGPANLVDMVATRRGLVSCIQNRSGGMPCHKVKTLEFEERSRLRNEGGYVSGPGISREGRGVLFFDCRQSRVARVALAHCAAQNTYRVSIFVVHRECVDCCLKAATKVEREGDVYFFRIADA